MSDTPAIQLTGIEKRFGAVRANAGASLEVAPGEIHALVGENGAGKSTLMRILAGLITPDAGTAMVDGRDVTGWRTSDAIAAGVGMVHQHFMLVPTLTVAENVVLGREPHRGPQLDLVRATSEVNAVAAKYGLRVDASRLVGDLSVGEAQRVEILKTLFRGARLLILDEPTAVLSPPEVQELWKVLRALKAGGGTIVLITHKLDEVMQVSDRITVMRRGETVARMVTAETTPAAIAVAMVGREVALAGAASFVASATPIGAAASLTVRDLVVAGTRRPREVDGVSFTVAPGEILGIAGVEGNGQSALLDAIAGLRPAASGAVLLGGTDVTALSVRERGLAGLAHIPEDRHRRGLILDFSVADNLILGRQDRFASIAGLDREHIDRNARAAVERFDIRPSDPSLPARALSGGNQQKIVIAREMGGEYRVLLAAQPTRGVDVGAIEFIHAQLRRARADGKAVLLVSAELQEILALADRVAVMYGGRIVGMMPRAQASESSLGPLMTGAGSERRMTRAELRERAEAALLPPLVALLVALVAGDVLIIAVGQSPAAVYRLLIEGTWGNWYGFGQVIYKTTTLMATGLAVSMGLRAGLFNIGAEGQLAAGGFAAALMGIILPAGMPALAAWPLCVMAAMAGGAAVGFVPGALRAKFGAHEVITTIMLNFIVLALLNWVIVAHLRVPETLHTPEIHAGALTRFSDIWDVFHGSAANVGILIVLANAVAAWWFLFRTRSGYDLRAVGLQPEAAEYGGVRTTTTWMRAMTISGMLAGLGGINFVLGYKHYYEEGFAGGAGYLGIAVALVGRNHPFGVVLAALFFATLSQGALAVNALVPKQLVEVLQGIIILAVAASVPEVRRAIMSARRSTES